MAFAAVAPAFMSVFAAVFAAFMSAFAAVVSPRPSSQPSPPWIRPVLSGVLAAVLPAFISGLGSGLGRGLRLRAVRLRRLSARRAGGGNYKGEGNPTHPNHSCLQIVGVIPCCPPDVPVGMNFIC